MLKTGIACGDEPGAMLMTDKACDKLCRSKALSDIDDVKLFVRWLVSRLRWPP